MGAGLMKQVIIELMRSGCRVETLAYNPPAIVFRSPDGTRRVLASSDGDLRLSGTPDGARFGSVREAIRAACAA